MAFCSPRCISVCSHARTLHRGGVFIHGQLNSLNVNPFIPATQLTAARLQLPDKRYKDSDARRRFFDQLLPRLRSIPGVSHAGIASDAPGLGAT